HAHPPHLPSVPTRRSSDLTPRAAEDAHRVRESAHGVVILDGVAVPGIAALAIAADGDASVTIGAGATPTYGITRKLTLGAGERTDRKSTRLNSSHVKISYA